MIRIIAIIASFILLTGRSLQAGFAPIVDFPGKVSWRAGPDAPDAVNTSDGIKFPCVFNAKTARVYWDYPVSADLSAAATIELELSCPNNEAVQSVGFYLQSGNGWYLWIQPLVKSGRQKFFFQVKNAATEGKPAGWNKIKAVRVSFQNNNATADTFMLLRGLKAGASGIILVNGTSSAPNNGERAVAQKTVARISKWLEDMGIAHSVLDDDDIATGKVRSASIIILPYNPQISDWEFGQLEKLSAGGSKLIVFYGKDPRLAELMDMQPGKYQAAGEPGQWSSFQFNGSAPEGMPRKIIQESGNIYTVFPKSDKSRIIAYWQDVSGKTLSDPAWVQSEKGAWMTHILLGEDSAKKKTMLFALLAQYDQEVYCKNPEKTGHDKTWPSTIQEKRHLPAVEGRALSRPQALLQLTQGNEFRGVWNHSGLGLYPGNWNKTCQLLANSGITAVFPNTLWAGTALYPSKYVSPSKEMTQFGDQMAQCIKAARASGIEIHAWKVCWNLGKADKEFIESMRKQGRLQKNSRNETLNWLCPSDSANIALELNTIVEVASRYDIDGIHLDYIRYPDDKSCCCAGCRQRYENWSGTKIKKWPQDVLSGKQSGNYKTWRARQITGFIRTVHAEIKKIKSGIKLSAAVYPKYPECMESIGQDWGLWLKEGIVDFVCPMDYLPTVSAFREILDRQLTLQNGNKRIYPGIGVTLDEGDLAGEIFIGQLRALRERQAGGFILFDLNPSLAVNFLPLIGEGIR